MSWDPFLLLLSPPFLFYFYFLTFNYLLTHDINEIEYLTVIGTLLYLTRYTRPDVESRISHI